VENRSICLLQLSRRFSAISGIDAGQRGTGMYGVAVTLPLSNDKRGERRHVGAAAASVSAAAPGFCLLLLRLVPSMPVPK
jgi:hypothetical protein